MQIKIKRLDKNLPVPVYAYKGDAAFDLLSREEIEVASGEWKEVPTGIALEIPDGYAGLIWDKSGIAIKNGIKTLGGVIDAGYRGEVKVGIVNLSNRAYKFEKGQKVAQMIIQKIEQVEFVEVSELSETDRGGKGFGSSGK
ncbi:MAG: dUTP pyrophosphatase [Parcubacteria group bacterium LiPW_30]|nr:MAG: dUTP pyrophosphatase [Parcubacteria group bacterium LiPW_30]